MKTISERIIFLDIDGVLNSTSSILLNGGDDEIFCPNAVKLLNMLIDITEAKLVISSSWRDDMQHVKTIFDSNGINPELIIGRTPKSNKYAFRGDEVDAWVKKNNFKGSYICIDDDNDFRYDNGLVKCDALTGFTLKQFILALHMFGIKDDPYHLAISYPISYFTK